MTEGGDFIILKVDQNLCIGCGLCCGICDEVFRMNEYEKVEAYQPANDDN
ncbi:ferredoxin [Blautia sp.]